MSSFDMSEFAAAGDAFDFENHGDTCRGIIARVKPPFMTVNKWTNAAEQKMVITVTQSDGTETAIWLPTDPFKQITGAVRDAVVKSTGSFKIEEGARIAVQYVSDQDVGKGNPMHVFTCAYAPPANAVMLESVAESVQAPVVAEPAQPAPAEDLLDLDF